MNRWGFAVATAVTLLVGCGGPDRLPRYPVPAGLEDEDPQPGPGRLKKREIPVKYAATAEVPAWEEGRVYRRDNGVYAVWVDPVTRVPTLAVHRLIEHKFKNRSPKIPFLPNEDLPAEGQVTSEEYDTPGQSGAPLAPYTRAQLVPQMDLDSLAHEKLTYLMSNVMPMNLFLHQQVWRDQVEEEIRQLVAAQSDALDDKALVFTGPLYFKHDTLRIPVGGEGPGVLLPSGFFKLVCLTGDDWIVDDIRIYVWILEEVEKPFRGEQYESLEWLETLTGITFLPEPSSD